MIGGQKIIKPAITILHIVVYIDYRLPAVLHLVFQYPRSIERQRLRHVPEMEYDCQCLPRQRGADLGDIDMPLRRVSALVSYSLPRNYPCPAGFALPESHARTVWSMALYLIGAALHIGSLKCESRLRCDARYFACERNRICLGRYLKAGILQRRKTRGVNFPGAGIHYLSEWDGRLTAAL